MVTSFAAELWIWIDLNIAKKGKKDMDLDNDFGSEKGLLTGLPRVILKRILGELETIDLAYLAGTFDKTIIARMSEGRTFEQLRIYIPPISPYQTGLVLFLLSILPHIPKLMYAAKGSLRPFTPVMVQRLYRLDCEHVTFHHQPEVMHSLSSQYLAKSRRALNLATMFPHLKTLELTGGWDTPAIVLDLVRTLPNGFQSFKVNWALKSFQNIMLCKVFDNLPLSTTSINVLQLAASPKGRASPDPVIFYDVQTRLPELAIFRVPYDALLFDPINRSTNRMPPQLWTTTLTAVSLRTEDLKPFSAYAFPASLRSFNLLVSTHHESFGNSELGSSAELPIIIQSLPYTLEELILRNPCGPRPSFDIGAFLPVGLTRLLMPPSWYSLLEMPSRMPQLKKLVTVGDSLPMFDVEGDPLYPSPTNCRLAPSVAHQIPLMTSLEVIDFASTTLCRANVPLLPTALKKLRIAANSLSTAMAIAVHCSMAQISIVNEVIIDEPALQIPEPKVFDAPFISLVLDQFSQGRLTISTLRLRPKYEFPPSISHLELVTNAVVKSVGAKIVIPILDPGTIQPLHSLVHLVVHGTYELGDAFWKALPASLTYLDIGTSPVKLIFDLQQLPPSLLHFSSYFKIDRNKLRWSALPKQLRTLHVPRWEVDECWSKKTPSTLTDLDISIDKINDGDLKKFVRELPNVEKMKLYVVNAFFYMGDRKSVV